MTDTSTLELTELEELLSISIPCDLGDGNPAKWIANYNSKGVCPNCNRSYRLICDKCRDHILKNWNEEGLVECVCGLIGTEVTSYSEFISSINPINKK